MKEVWNKVLKVGKTIKFAYAMVLVCVGIFGCVVIAYSVMYFVYLNYADLGRDAIRFIILTLAVLGESWQFWVVALGGLLWAYSYRRNRQRQESIIELLLEIRRKLG